MIQTPPPPLRGEPRARPRALVLAWALLAILALGGLGGCGGNGETSSTSTTSSAGKPAAPQSAGIPRPPAPDDVIGGRPGGPADSGNDAGGHGEPKDAFPPERPEPGTRPAGKGVKGAIEAAVRTYLSALNAHDGKIVCALFVSGALDSIALPVRSSDCAPSVTASLGFAAPGGQPRWLQTKLVDADSVVRVRGGDGRLTGTVVHRFAGSREPSIEDDVIYLRRSGGRWLIVKPSATFYRAIGVGDVPLSALAPPRG